MKVSLILTVLNEGDALRPLLESILAQSRPPDEIVVVDGGSRDETVAILESYCDRLSLRVIVAPGAGISQGRNIAIRHARHEVIAVTDGGVRLDPAWLEHLTGPFGKRGAHCASPPDLVSGFFRPDPRSRFEDALAATTLPAPEEMGRGRFLPSSRSVAFTKAIWTAVGGYPEWMSYSEDVLFDLALLRGGARIAYMPEAVVYFRPRPSLAAFARQYRNYAYGDGQGLLWPRRHAIRYATYLLALPLALTLLARRPTLGLVALAGGGGAMFFTPLKRLARLQLAWQHKVAAAPLIPIIRLVGDLAKMAGFPRGLPEGWANRDRTKAYLSQNLTADRKQIE
ncbi:MAG TPA: glycosyl transferase family 2 [Chloroflexi bacterium]|nr:glycosyl transferase family 2 [Chloroflexota bacterium]